MVMLFRGCSSVFVVGAGINTAAATAVYNKSLRLSRESLEGPRLGQALNFQVAQSSRYLQTTVVGVPSWYA